VSRSRFALLLALLVLALPFALTACGGDKEAAKKPRTTTTRTERTTPRTDTVPAPPVQTTPAPSTTSQNPATAPNTPGEGNGSTRGTPQGGSDSPQNDTPPPAGSPAERFEKDCESRPKTCG
jgi:type IV secretory pathway VirB10-like protein